MSKESFVALRDTVVADPTGCARAFARLCIARAAIETLALLLAVFAEPALVARPIARVSLPSNCAQTLARFGIAFGAVGAVALVQAVRAISALVADLVARSSFVARRARALSIDWRALSTIMAFARQLAILAVREERTGSIAQAATPTGLAFALSRPRMANFRRIFAAFARQIAVFAVHVIVAFSFLARFSLPAVGAEALAIGRIAFRSVVATARFRTILAEFVFGTVVVALVAGETGSALAFARDVMAIRAVVALAHLFALFAEETGLASIGAHVARPTCPKNNYVKVNQRRAKQSSKSILTWRTLAFAVLRVAFAVVLAFALLLALFAVFAIGTCLRTQWARETSSARTFAGNVMAFAAILAATRFRAIQSVLAVRALQFASVARVSFGAFAQTIELVANAVVLALARMRTIFAPHARWTLCVTHKHTIEFNSLIGNCGFRTKRITLTDITSRPIVASITFAHFRCHAFAMHARRADGYTSIARHVLPVSG